VNVEGKDLTFSSALSNPRVSEEAKQHAREVLDTELQGGDVGVKDEREEHRENVARGLKA